MQPQRPNGEARWLTIYHRKKLERKTMIICLRDPSKISIETTGFARRGQVADHLSPEKIVNKRNERKNTKSRELRRLCSWNKKENRQPNATSTFYLFLWHHPLIIQLRKTMIICLRPSKISRETTGFARRGQAADYVLFNTGNNSQTKTKDEEVEEPRPHVKTKKRKKYIFQLPRSFKKQKLLVKPRRGQAADCTI